jgi:hypothetical protein
VDEDIDLGSLFWLGALADLPPGTSWADEENPLMEVATANKTPDLKGRVFRRTVGLTFWKGALPW